MDIFNKIKFKVIFYVYKIIWYLNSFKENNVCIIVCNSLHYEMTKNIHKNLSRSYLFPATKQAKVFFKKNNISYRWFVGFPKIVLSSDFLEGNERYLNELSISSRSLINIKNVKKIQTYHGVADKNWTYSNYNHEYDLLLVPGDYSEKRLIEIGVPKSKIKVIGFTKFSNKFYFNKKRKKENKKKTILYAPTHGVISSLPFMAKSLITLKDEYKLIFKPHVCTREEGVYIRFFKKLGIEIYENDEIEDLFFEADVLISDTSSIMFEFLLTGKPVIALDFNIWITEGESLNSKIGPEIVFRNMFYRVKNVSKIKSTIEKAFSDYDYTNNKKTLKLLFDINDNPAKKAALEIEKFMKN